MDIYHQFFKSYYEDNKKLLLDIYEGPLNFTNENYLSLALQVTKVTLSDFAVIEKKIKLTIPLEFKSFFMTAYSYERYFQTPTMTLAVPWYENPFIELKSLLFEQGASKYMLKNKLIPIGFYEDNFYVCLDLREDETSNNPPITYFDLDAWQIEDKPAFQSFRDFIQNLTNSIISGVYL